MAPGNRQIMLFMLKR